MVVRRKLCQNPDINMLMTTTLNSALYHKYRDEKLADRHKDDEGSANILHTASTVKTQIIFDED
jgi:hypothetical protein